MEINVTGRHMSVTDALKEYAESKLKAVVEGYNKITSAKIILDVQKTRSKAEVIVHGKNINVESDAESYDMYESIDTVIKKVDKQLQHHFDRVQDHHKVPIKESEASSIAKSPDGE